MKINFGEFEEAKTEVAFDYGTLCAVLNTAQAASLTATLALIVDDQCAAERMSSTEHAVVLFRNEQGWQHSPAAMHGNFHASAAALLNDKPL